MNSRNIFSVYDVLNLSSLVVEDAKLVALTQVAKAKNTKFIMQAAVIEAIIRKANSTQELVNRISDFVLIH